ncbi:hypothetical protein RJ639_018674 [Escallonia herrerae]|uniref:non-specific serine/threonine protein kinase n=1 Tax=Escallonia herrerae TaxID=1293975 RepID=A0AA89AI28_9ASTE|nr:hypothetical protein RJ639_018674 [Escallonia herrerae]
MRCHNHKPPHCSLLFFHLLSSLFLHSATSKIHKVLKRGSSLSVEVGSDIITSPDGSFACGFRNKGGNAYWLAVWFTNSADRTVVWTANRDRPVNGKGSNLSLQRNGVMCLTDVDGKVVWHTNITTNNAQRAEVLDTGNLVLKDPQGEILWQSFDYPTDTLLPSQTFTMSNKLIAVVKKGNFASGYFSNDNVLRLFYDGPETSSIYWPNLAFSIFQNGRASYNSSRIAVLDDMGRFASSDRLKFSASDLGFGIKRRLTMDYDGNLRLYSLDSSSGSWAALAQHCNVHGLCGRNGICIYSPEPKCSCPPGYEASDPSDWSQGCKPTFNRTCSDSQRVKFVEVPNTDYFGFDLAYRTGPISVEACRELCLGDCNCEAFSYRQVGDVLCFTKSALFNGLQTPDFPGSMFLKLPASVEASQTAVLLGSNAMCESSTSTVLLGSPTMYYTDTERVRWVYLYSVAFGIGAIESLIILSGWWFLFRRSRVPATVEDGYRVLLSRFRSYGIVILELVRGVRLLTWVIEGAEEQEVELTRFVRTLKTKIECREECWMEDLVDPRLNGEFNRNQAAALVEIGLACMEQDRNAAQLTLFLKASTMRSHNHKPPHYSLLFFHLLSSLILHSATSKIHNGLKRGSSLSVEDSSDIITSPDGSFACGFRNVGGSAYWLAIWFTNSAGRTVVWTANRDNPVNGKGSKLSLRRNGVMFLTDVDGKENGRTSYNSSRIANFDDEGRFLSSDLLQFNASDMGIGIKRRLTMDYDGNLRLYSLNSSSGSWSVSWAALSQNCNVHGLCGRNGICTYSPEPKCACPPGYEPSDPSDWNQGCKPTFKKTCSDSQQVKFVEIPSTDYFGFDLDHRNGPISVEACRDLCLQDCRCEAFSYRQIGTILCYTKSALFNGLQTQQFPGSVFLKLPSSVEASRTTVLHGSNALCETSAPTVLLDSPTMYNTRTKKVRWVYLYSFALTVGAIESLIIVSGWWFLFRKRSVPAKVEDGYRVMLSHFRRFNYAELKKATDNFKEELGRGGFGIVYKGVLTDARAVAVKRLGDMHQGEQEFWAEVSTIGKINHMNLVRMWGFCSEGRHRLLVYEYVENLSLDKHLFTSNFLGWKERFNVALRTARGLAYLHHECLEWVIHCDVKPENILLDSAFEPKITDFGLAKLSKRGGRGSDISRIRGTKGYMAPEWALNLPITAKVDVYSYGVVILELVRGVRLATWVVEDAEEQEVELTRFVSILKTKIQHREESWMEDVVDPRLKGQFNRFQAAALVEIGLACMEEDRSKRPTMDTVVQVLLESEAE